MLRIKTNHPLGQYTTIKVGALADYFAILKNKAELLEALEFSKKNKQPITILGGGSNILFSQRIKGLVLKNEIKGINILEKGAERVLVEGLSGEAWSKFVSFTVDHKFYGLENLFLIYGTVGAAPVQNIGAYGVEFKDSFHHLKAIDLKTGHEKIFSAADCQFAYRDSVFKNKFKGRYFIYSVVVSLALTPSFQLAYGSIKEKLAEKGIKKITISDIVNVISEIRNSKLPNPYILPNSGSFFKNPEITKVKFKKLQQQYPEIPSFSGQGNKIKIPAGWLIEQVGLKGKKFGPVRMYEKQALILVNEGGASPKQVLSLVAKVKAAVKKKFDLDLSEEVNII
ncbi:MAG TPA: UDP-N-acetylmuramate dehydrogenase [Candidatus Saccharimonadales bacterium]|nr:UDP-N-acetylmuramate dehydrogenase [Candidatus Saccharimonadales bacterium]